MRRFALLAALALAAPARAEEVPPARFLPGPERIAVAATPVPLDPADPAHDRVGALRWRGGVALTARDVRLGGLSALRWHGGVLMSVSDEGNFFAFRPVERHDRLIGVARMRVRRLAGADGRPLTGKAASDFESLEIATDPRCVARTCPATQATVSLETTSDVLTYRLHRNLPVGAPVAMRAAAAWRARQSRTNGGIEAQAGSRDVWLIASEEMRRPDGSASAWLLPAAAPEAAAGAGYEVGIEVRDGFNPTDLALIGERPATFLMLERHYTKADGVAMRLVRFALRPGGDPTRLAPGAVETLATLRPPLTVDNMEGLAVRRERGRTFLYMISDDNFSADQRTLLTKWELVG